MGSTNGVTLLGTSDEKYTVKSDDVYQRLLRDQRDWGTIQDAVGVPMQQGGMRHGTGAAWSVHRYCR